MFVSMKGTNLYMYYIFLTILFLYACAIAIISNRIKKKDIIILYVFFLIALSFLFAIRPSEVPDFNSYKRIFTIINNLEKYTPNILKREPTTDTEYGFIGIVLLFKIIFGDLYRFFLFLITIVSLHITVIYIKKLALLIDPKSHVNYISILVLFFPYYGMYYQGIAIRGGIAIMFIIMTLYYYIKKKYFLSMCAVFLGFIIQRMSILALLVCAIYQFFPVLKKRIYYFAAMIMIIVAVICNFTQGKILIPLYNLIGIIFSKIFTIVDYSGYLSRADVNRIIDKKRLFVLFVFAALIFFINESDIALKRILNLVFASAILIFATLSIVGSERIFDLFSCFSVVILSIKLGDEKSTYPKWYIHCFSLIYMICNFFIAVRVWMNPNV